MHLSGQRSLSARCAARNVCVRDCLHSIAPSPSEALVPPLRLGNLSNIPSPPSPENCGAHRAESVIASLLPSAPAWKHRQAYLADRQPTRTDKQNRHDARGRPLLPLLILPWFTWSRLASRMILSWSQHTQDYLLPLPEKERASTLPDYLICL